ncbi:hypothetical protein AA106555_1970 [Neokomagataea thailandica NBRC 106555]|uniref:Uncharacterized protein n=2 Tax=Neokomagataea TaxID=1223423 RepID=A0A4Y6V4C6_9PROT|nr:hypothetical protein [Neokomagataea tanensis]QDH24919.1 hypothetical protein D5366_06505 [Neokomagataea tanensis]GBR55249.1 hypothetical protein AA106555_1970 [Neokomagataea thailandica NBRC 106555]
MSPEPKAQTAIIDLSYVMGSGFGYVSSKDNAAVAKHQLWTSFRTENYKKASDNIKQIFGIKDSRSLDNMRLIGEVE